MKPIITFVIVASLVFGSTVVTYSQNPEQLYQKALVKEEGEGALQEAINLYSQVADNSTAANSLQAKALLHIGLCYEKLGKEEALKAYQRLVNDYPGQKQEVAIARERLSKLTIEAEELGLEEETKTSPKSISIQKVWTDENTDNSGTPSPNGKYLSYMDGETGNLAIREISSGKSRLITKEGTWDDPMQFTICSTFSPDNKNIAYSWYNTNENYDVRVVDKDKPNPKIIYGNEDEDVYPCAWSPDGKTIYARSYLNKTRQCRILAIDVSSGETKALKTFDFFYWMYLCVSPDNRFIVYDCPVGENKESFDIYLLSTDGETNRPLIEHPANDRILGWFPNQNIILFKSDRSGNWDVWTTSITDVKNKTNPKRILKDFGQITPMGFTSNGDYYHSLFSREFRGFYSPFDKNSAKLNVENKHPLLGSLMYIQWSPNGKYLAYNKEVTGAAGPGWYNRPACILNLESGEEQKLHDELELNSPKWSADNRSVLVSGFDEKKENQNDYNGEMFEVDIETLSVKSLFEFQKKGDGNGNLSWWRLAKDWSAAKDRVFYLGYNQIVCRNLSDDTDKILVESENLHRLVLDLSPDEKLLLYCADNKLCAIPLAGGDEILLFTEEKTNMIRNAKWSPDGTSIFYTHPVNQKNYDDGSVLKRIAVDGKTSEKIWHSKNAISSFDIHPNEDALVFSTFKQEMEIWKVENLLPSEKLAQKEETKEPKGIRIRQISKKPYLDDLGTVSSDGRYLSCVDWDGDGDLAIHDLKNGEKTILTDKATLDDDPQKFVIGSAISKNGKKVAYSWWRPYHTYDLHIFDVGTGTSKLLYKEEKMEVYPVVWLSDNQLIVIRQDRKNEQSQLTLFNVSDGNYVDLKSIDIRYWSRLAACPDGNTIAFNTKPNDEGKTDIYLLSIDGKAEIPLIEHPADDKVIGWIPNRNEFLFISDRSGTWDLWAVSVVNGETRGEPIRLYNEVGEIAPVGISETGECFCGFSKRNFNAYVMPVNDSGKPEGKSKIPLAGSIYSKNWSPDGKYMTRVQEGNRSFDLILSDVKNGNEKKLAEELFYKIGPYWYGDNRTVYFYGIDQKMLQTKGYKGGIYKVDINTNNLEQKLLISDYDYTPSEDDAFPISGHVVSKDEKYIFLLFQNNWIVKRDLATGSNTILYRHPKFVRGVLQLSPDGEKLLFAVNDEKEKVSHLLTISTEGTDEEELCTSQESFISGSAFWSPDGEYVYFAERAEGTNLWRVDAIGGTPEKVWKTDKGAESFVMHPSGEKISYSVRERTTEIRVIEGLNQELDKIYSLNE